MSMYNYAQLKTAKLQQENASLQAKIGEQQKRIILLSSQLEDLEDSYNEELCDFKKRNNDLEAKVKELQEERDGLKNKY